MLKFAAIDVGSNAIRMTVGDVDNSWRVKAIENICIPVRLGQDVFAGGMLEETSMQRTLDAFRRFQHEKHDEVEKLQSPDSVTKESAPGEK